MYVKDPTKYPVIFTLPKRNFSIVDNKTASCTFMATSGNLLKNCFYFFNENYLTDVDFGDGNVVLVREGKNVLFEYYASSLSLFSCDFNIRAWSDEVTSKTIKSGEHVDLKQSPLNSVNTSCSFYCSNSMKQFNANIVDGISYYASIRVNINFYPKYYSDFLIEDIEVNPGQNVSSELIDPQNYGILYFVSSLSADWYYDKERTLPVVSVPESISFNSKYFSSRLFFHKPGKFSNQGTTNSDGVSVFSGVATQNYVISSGMNYGSLVYIKENVDTGEKIISEEEEVEIDDNGYCLKEGQISQIYVL